MEKQPNTPHGSLHRSNPDLEDTLLPEQVRAPEYLVDSYDPTQPNRRQQDKLMAVMKTKEIQIFAQPRLDLSPKSRKEFLRDLSSGTIGAEDLHDALMGITPPDISDKDTGRPVLYDKISGDRRIMGIITMSFGDTLDTRDSITSGDLAELLEKYPEPLMFEPRRQEILSIIENNNSPAKLQQYEVAMNAFLHTVYGKRYEYYSQYRLLEQEARSVMEKPLEKIRALGKHALGRINLFSGAEVQEEIPPQVERVPEKAATQILRSTEIHGSETPYGPLTTEILAREGLGPSYKINIEGLDIWSSVPYLLDQTRQAVVAYVRNDEGEVVARSYYRSASQGVWRYLPDYRPDPKWYGKGHGEESVTLPIDLQQALSSISTYESNNPKKTETVHPERILLGTAPSLEGYARSDFYSQVHGRPRHLEGLPYIDEKAHSGRKIEPERVSPTQQQSPDFTDRLATWTQQTTIYGDVVVEVYPSQDRQLKYMMYRDSRGRSWVGGIENSSKLTSTGLRQEWVSGGDLVTPAYEYSTARVDATGGYGNDLDRRGHYVDMYQNYISRIPIVKNYIQLSNSGRR